MSLKLERFCGTITTSDTAADTAAGLELGKLSRGSAFRVSEFGGQDVFIKITITSDRTTVTSTNGMYLRANSTIVAYPEGFLVGSGEGRVVLDGTDTSSSNAVDFLVLDGTDSDSNNAGDAVFYDFTNTSYFISVINETAGSDGAVHVEEVSQGNPVAS